MYEESLFRFFCLDGGPMPWKGRLTGLLNNQLYAAVAKMDAAVAKMGAAVAKMDAAVAKMDAAVAKMDTADSATTFECIGRATNDNERCELEEAEFSEERIEELIKDAMHAPEKRRGRAVVAMTRLISPFSNLWDSCFHILSKYGTDAGKWCMYSRTEDVLLQESKFSQHLSEEAALKKPNDLNHCKEWATLEYQKSLFAARHIFHVVEHGLFPKPKSKEKDAGDEVKAYQTSLEGGCFSLLHRSDASPGGKTKGQNEFLFMYHHYVIKFIKLILTAKWLPAHIQSYVHKALAVCVERSVIELAHSSMDFTSSFSGISCVLHWLWYSDLYSKSVDQERVLLKFQAELEEDASDIITAGDFKAGDVLKNIMYRIDTLSKTTGERMIEPCAPHGSGDSKSVSLVEARCTSSLSPIVASREGEEASATGDLVSTNAISGILNEERWQRSLETIIAVLSAIADRFTAVLSNEGNEKSHYEWHLVRNVQSVFVCLSQVHTSLWEVAYSRKERTAQTTDVHRPPIQRVELCERSVQLLEQLYSCISLWFALIHALLSLPRIDATDGIAAIQWIEYNCVVGAPSLLVDLLSAPVFGYFVISLSHDLKVRLECVFKRLARIHASTCIHLYEYRSNYIHRYLRIERTVQLSLQMAAYSPALAKAYRSCYMHLVSLSAAELWLSKSPSLLYKCVVIAVDQSRWLYEMAEKRVANFPSADGDLAERCSRFADTPIGDESMRVTDFLEFVGPLMSFMVASLWLREGCASVSSFPKQRDELFQEDGCSLASQMTQLSATQLFASFHAVAGGGASTINLASLCQFVHLIILFSLNCFQQPILRVKMAALRFWLSFANCTNTLVENLGESVSGAAPFVASLWTHWHTQMNNRDAYSHFRQICCRLYERLFRIVYTTALLPPLHELIGHFGSKSVELESSILQYRKAFSLLLRSLASLTPLTISKRVRETWDLYLNRYERQERLFIIEKDMKSAGMAYATDPILEHTTHYDMSSADNVRHYLELEKDIWLYAVCLDMHFFQNHEIQRFLRFLRFFKMDYVDVGSTQNKAAAMKLSDENNESATQCFLFPFENENIAFNREAHEEGPSSVRAAVKNGYGFMKESDATDKTSYVHCYNLYIRLSFVFISATVYERCCPQFAEVIRYDPKPKPSLYELCSMHMKDLWVVELPLIIEQLKQLEVTNGSNFSLSRWDEAKVAILYSFFWKILYYCLDLLVEAVNSLLSFLLKSRDCIPLRWVDEFLSDILLGVLCASHSLRRSIGSEYTLQLIKLYGDGISILKPSSYVLQLQKDLLQLFDIKIADSKGLLEYLKKPKSNFTSSDGHLNGCESLRLLYASVCCVKLARQDDWTAQTILTPILHSQSILNAYHYVFESIFKQSDVSCDGSSYGEMLSMSYEALEFLICFGGRAAEWNAPIFYKCARYIGHTFVQTLLPFPLIFLKALIQTFAWNPIHAIKCAIIDELDICIKKMLEGCQDVSKGGYGELGERIYLLFHLTYNCSYYQRDPRTRHLLHYIQEHFDSFILIVECTSVALQLPFLSFKLLMEKRYSIWGFLKFVVCDLLPIVYALCLLGHPKAWTLLLHLYELLNSCFTWINGDPFNELQKLENVFKTVEKEASVQQFINETVKASLQHFLEKPLNPAPATHTCSASFVASTGSKEAEAHPSDEAMFESAPCTTELSNKWDSTLSSKEMTAVLNVSAQQREVEAIQLHSTLNTTSQSQHMAEHELSSALEKPEYRVFDRICVLMAHQLLGLPMLENISCTSCAASSYCACSAPKKGQMGEQAAQCFQVGISLLQKLCMCSVIKNNRLQTILSKTLKSYEHHSTKCRILCNQIRDTFATPKADNAEIKMLIVARSLMEELQAAQHKRGYTYFPTSFYPTEHYALEKETSDVFTNVRERGAGAPLGHPVGNTGKEIVQAPLLKQRKAFYHFPKRSHKKGKKAFTRKNTAVRLKNSSGVAALSSSMA